MPQGEVQRRSAFALLGIPIAIAIIRMGGWAMAIALGTVAALGVRELYRMAVRAGTRPLTMLGGVASVLVVVYAAFRPTWSGWAPGAFAVIGALTFVSLATVVRDPTVDAHPLGSVGVTVLGPLYVGVPFGFAILLRESVADPWLGAIFAIFPIAVTWAGDSAAYFGGRRWGRRRLAPTISPGKTVEGSWAGLVGSIAMALLVVTVCELWIPGFPIGYGTAVVLGVGIGVTGQFGDLVESTLKRASSIKDSGSFLPGHGGVLDRFDGVFFALPVTWAILALAGMVE